MNLVLQCAMCGIHHPVGTPACSACRASGVPQLRLMFECPTCGGLGLNPACGTCPAPASQSDPTTREEPLIVAEEVFDDEFVPVLVCDDEDDEKVVVDLSEDDFDFDEDD